MYPGFAQVAREEGFKNIATIFESIAVAEKQHEKRYLGLLANVENGTVFKRTEPVVWRCRNCGYLHTGTEAPVRLPGLRPQAGALRAAGRELVGRRRPTFRHIEEGLRC